MKQIALIKTGSTIPEIKPHHGDFEDWFAEGLGVTDLLQVDVYKQQALPEVDNLAGIVITGSAAMVSAKEDWSERTARWLARAVDSGTAVLGVCYGHQLLAQALGGRVGPNPAGRQIGTVPAKLLDSAAGDALLGHLPVSFPVQTSHSEVVLELPRGVDRLATSPLDDNFAIRFAENAWGVQFHPEFSAPVMARYLKLRSEEIRAEGLNPEEIHDKLENSDTSKTVLRRFAQLILSS